MRGFSRIGQCFALIGKHDVHIFHNQLVEEVTFGFHHIVACHVETNLKSFFLGQLYGAQHQVMVLQKIAFNIEIIISGKHFTRQVFCSQCGSCSQISTERTLSIGRNESRRNARRQIAGGQQGIYPALTKGIAKESSCLVLTYLSDKSGIGSQCGQCTDRIAGRTTGRAMNLHP